MLKLGFLLRVYARPAYKALAVVLLLAAAAAVAAHFAGLLAPVLLVLGILGGALLALAATVAILVANAAAAAWLHRVIERFEAAYNSYRKANRLADPFYEAMDLEDAAAEADGAA